VDRWRIGWSVKAEPVEKLVLESIG